MSEGDPFSLVPSICVVREWEEAGEQDTSMLTNGLAGVKTGASGPRSHIDCLRCGVELIYDATDGSLKGNCPLDKPDRTVVNLFNKPTPAT